MDENKNSTSHEDKEQTTSSDEHRRRMRFEWQDLMDDLIEDGRRRGLFDDLPGQGRPLDLQENIYEGSNTLANQLMKNNDIRPPWLVLRLEVTGKIDKLRNAIDQTWNRYRTAFAQNRAESHRPALTLGWDEVCQRWQAEIDKLNREIETYNLKRPPGQPEIFKLRLQDELERVGAPRYLR